MAAAEYRKTFPVSWQELHRDAKALAWRLVESGPWHGIIAVTRGGLVPAAIVSREMELRVVDTICVASYDHMSQGVTRILKDISAVATAGDKPGQGWLVVDDLVDTGATFRIVRERLPAAHFATVYAKPAGRPMVDTYITEVSQDTWIMFPWDTEPQFAPPIAGRGNGR